MFKKEILFLVLMAAPVTAFAQLKVKSNGYVVAGTELPSTYAIKPRFQAYYSTSSSSDFCCAIYGKMDNTTNQGIAYGVYGVGQNAGSGANIGVAGVKGSSSMNGTGIFGCTFPAMVMGVSGNYAGLFWGDTKVDGTLTATSIVQSSDLRLKENITPLNYREKNILDKVLNMNVIEYNYKKTIVPGLVLTDSVSVEEQQKMAGVNMEKKHIGLIAQELQDLFPTLVEEGQDGYLAVNYIELVPVLISAIQELKAELDEIKKSDVGKTRSVTNSKERIYSANPSNVLYQNTPNPFKEQTLIRFKLANGVQDATICIFDMTGKTLKKIPISSGMESVSVGGYELGEGMFLYSLVVNGQEIDTKRMIITK